MNVTRKASKTGIKSVENSNFELFENYETLRRCEQFRVSWGFLIPSFHFKKVKK